MNKCAGLALGLLSLSSLYAAEDVIVSDSSSDEVVGEVALLPEVRKDNYAAVIEELYQQGGTALLKRELTRLLSEEAHALLNPKLEETHQTHPLEYVVSLGEDGPELARWLLKNGADSEATNRIGSKIKNVIDEEPFISIMAQDRIRKKVEPFIGAAHCGVELEKLVAELHALVEAEELIQEEVVTALNDIAEEAELDALTIRYLLAAYQNKQIAEAGHGKKSSAIT